MYEHKNYKWEVKEPTGKNRRELKNMASKIRVENGTETIIELKQGDIEVYNFCNRLKGLKKGDVEVPLTIETFDNLTDMELIDKIIESINIFDIEFEQKIKK
jgi:hypothetical protein